MNRSVASLLVSVACWCSGSVDVHGQCDRIEDFLLAGGPSVDQSSWQPVDIENDWAVVGAPTASSNAGRAYVYRFDGSGWVLHQTLSASDGADSDNFGAGVSIEGDAIAVGAPSGPGSSADSGAVYIFRLVDNNVWIFEQKVFVTGTLKLGGSVSLSSDKLLVGGSAPPSINNGRAYVFRYEPGNWVLEQQLIGLDVLNTDTFGQSVSLDNDRALVGAHLKSSPGMAGAGAAYLFRFDAGVWSQEAKFEASDRAAQDLFGFRVALHSDVAVMGAMGVDSGGLLGVGAVYVFRYDGASWAQEAKLMHGQPVEGVNLGVGVATNGNTIIAGAISDLTSSMGLGSALVFRSHDDNWYLDQRLIPSGRQDFLGAAAAIDGSRAIVWANAGEGTSSALVYELQAADCNSNGILDAAEIALGFSADCEPNCIPDSCELANVTATDCNANLQLDRCDIIEGLSIDCNYNQLPDECDIAFGSSDCDADGTLEECPSQQSFSPFDGTSPSSYLGWAVQVRDQGAIAGEPSPFGSQEPGGAFVYALDGVQWSVDQHLAASDGHADDEFGAAVSISGDVALVGAPNNTNANGTASGAAYVFRRVNGVWTEERKLMASDGVTNDHFGNAVAIDGDLALVGAYAGPFGAGSFNIGCVYAFRYSAGSWSEIQKLGDATTPGAQDRFGISVSMDGTVAAIGADRDITPTVFVNGGVAHIYRFNGTSWVSEAKIWAPDAADNAQFGSNVAINGDRAAIAANQFDAPGQDNVGKVYVFQKNGASWSLQQELDAPEGLARQGFACSVGIDGDTLIVGSVSDAHVSGSTGSAFLYHWDGAAWSTAAKLTEPTSASFGLSVAVAGNVAMTQVNNSVIFYEIVENDCNSDANPDICELAGGQAQDCQSNELLDECDIASGASQDVNLDAVPDECTTVRPQIDETGLQKTRFISFSVPTPLSVDTALRVRLVSLHYVIPPYTGGPSIPFTSFESEIRWVGPPTQYVESSASGGPFFASQLQCAPHYQDWSTIGLLHVTGSAITPSSVYEVENLAVICMGDEDTCSAISAPLTVATTRWGDVRAPYNPPDPSVQPDISDVSALVDKFRNAPGAPIKARAILAGEAGNAFGEITHTVLNVDFGFSHISSCVDAFRGVPYPYTIRACP